MSHSKMQSRFSLVTLLLVMAVVCLPTALIAQAQDNEIPEALRPWRGWATWDLKDLEAPAIFNNSDDRVSFWPSELSLEAAAEKGSWKIVVTTFSKTWVPLPGSANNWPQNVVGNGKPVAVVERDIQYIAARSAVPTRVATPRELEIVVG